jgi:hypothetical protein
MSPQQIKVILWAELTKMPFVFYRRYSTPAPADFIYPNGLSWFDYLQAPDEWVFYGWLLSGMYREPAPKFG